MKLTSPSLREPHGSTSQLNQVAVAAGAEGPDGRLTAAEYRPLVEHSPVMIWRSDRSKKCDYFNRVWLAFTGRTMAEELGDGWAEGVHPDDLERCVEIYSSSFDERRPFEMEYRLRRHDGVYRWIFDRGVPYTDDRGDFLGYIGSCVDVTDRREAEELRRKTEDQFRLLVEQVNDYAILMLDPAGRIVSWNEGARRIKGYTAEEILGRSFETFYPEEAVASGFPRHELEAAERDGRFEDEGWRVRKDGSRFWANVIVTAIRGQNGALAGFAKVTRDLTTRREAEQRRRELAAEQAAHAALAKQNAELQELNHRLAQAVLEAERARAATEEAYRELDQFAYVASHDLKAPLRGISSLAQWIEEDVGEHLSGESLQHMRLLRGRVHRLQSLIDGILTYSRAGRVLTRPERVDTGRLVSEIADLQVPAEVRIDVAPGMPMLEAERIPLQQVFMNLIGNAVKYAAAARPDAQIAVSWRDMGGAFEFSVGDNGPGIPAEFHDRIWELLQTLESRDKVEGAGIGLAVVKKIVETRGGRVSLESSEGQGATFRFTWPKRQVTTSV
jgi:PAS domain S-box-containing protein